MLCSDCTSFGCVDKCAKGFITSSVPDFVNATHVTNNIIYNDVGVVAGRDLINKTVEYLLGRGLSTEEIIRRLVEPDTYE